MTLLFVDGVDHYVTADVTKKWSETYNLPVVAGAGRRGGGAFQGYIGTGWWVSKTIPATSSLVMGVAFKMVNSITAAADIFRLLDGSSLQCGLRVNPDLTLTVHRAGTALTGGTSAVTFPMNAFAYLEWKVTISDAIAASSCIVRMNGVEIINVTAGQDTKATANSTATKVALGGGTGSGGNNSVADDFYLCDQSGTTNNNFLGDVRVDTLYPNADGSYTDFTPSTGTSHYALVDESAPSATDYNSSSTVGHRDSYGLANLAALTSQVVYGVQVNAALLKDDAGARTAATMVRSGTTNGDGAEAAMGITDSYVSQVYELNPATSTAWTETTVNAMEAGVRIVT